MSKDRKITIVDGPRCPLFGNGGTLIRTSNLRQWVSFDNGASLVSSWNVEGDVALLGYSGDGEVEGEIKTATFTVKRNVGPTASAASCSPSRLRATNEEPFTDQYYWPHGSGYLSVTDLINNFSSGGGSPGDNSPKPSNLHMLIARWFEYDSLDPYEDPSGDFFNGVFELGVGGGDIVSLKNLTTGSETYIFSNTNELEAGETNGPDQTTDWNGGGMSDVAAKPHAIWLQEPLNEADVWQISLRPPSWGEARGGGLSTVPGSPVGIRYYVAVYIIEGCAGLVGAGLTAGSFMAKPESPRHDRMGKATFK